MSHSPSSEILVNLLPLTARRAGCSTRADSHSCHALRVS